MKRPHPTPPEAPRELEAPSHVPLSAQEETCPFSTLTLPDGRCVLCFCFCCQGAALELISVAHYLMQLAMENKHVTMHGEETHEVGLVKGTNASLAPLQEDKEIPEDDEG